MNYLSLSEGDTITVKIPQNEILDNTEGQVISERDDSVVCNPVGMSPIARFTVHFKENIAKFLIINEELENIVIEERFSTVSKTSLDEEQDTKSFEEFIDDMEHLELPNPEKIMEEEGHAFNDLLENHYIVEEEKELHIEETPVRENGYYLETFGDDKLEESYEFVQAR